MKYILITTLFTILLYGKEVDSRQDYDWCVKIRDIETWVLVDKYGNLYDFTSKELYDIADSTYNKVRYNTRVKQIILRDIATIKNVE